MKIGAVLPLSIRGSYDVDDLNRADMLFRTLKKFAEPGMFDPLLVVTPENEVEVVKERFMQWADLGVKVISEETLVPEFIHHPKVRGWRKQQIIKLAAARYIEHMFFITFDADVICVKPLTVNDLVVNNRAILQYEPRDGHMKWWKSSSRILNMPLEISDPDLGMSVTPAVLSTEICKRFANDLSISNEGSWVDQLCSLHDIKRLSNLTLRRFRMRRWTEYSLYYLYALKLGLLDQFHQAAGTRSIPQLLSVRAPDPIGAWNVGDSFSSECEALFCVVNSKSATNPELVWEKIKSYVV